ncbi:MAG: class I SAM-dependent methyltransferase [Anaerolineae bacterium]|jgi:23S rRNA (cytosine1962-C5)-methyltransferase
MQRLADILDRCITARAALFDPEHTAALRLFNGFLEGEPDLIVDLYASTLVLTNYADPPERGAALVEQAQPLLRSRLPWLQAGILKTRKGRSLEERRGTFLFGELPDEKVREHGVWYAVNPLMHQDAGLYVDTRNLRRWALDRLQGKTVLNTFAYTGSLGVAALAGGAARAVQLDHNPAYLEVARRSCELNGLPVRDADFLAGDFFRQAAALKRREERFDCVFLDPPFFSTGASGTVDQVGAGDRLINKVRPLVADGGSLVAVNNAVFVGGNEYMHMLEALCSDGYLEIQQLIPVPDDFAGYPETRTGNPITDPAPFNHSTKIAVLTVRRKAP